MPERKAGVGTKIDEWRADPEVFAEALDLTGNRLVLHRFGDGFTRVEEYRGRRRILKSMMLDEQADIIEENFDGQVEWE